MTRLLRVDDEVFAALEKRARPFVDTPNTTLRRLLGLEPGTSRGGESAPPASSKEAEALIDELSFGMGRTRRRAGKVDLEALVRLRVLKDGDRLRLLDYRGMPLRGREAIVDSGRLRFAGKLHSMSGLARLLLAEAGFVSGAVRGPAHWADAKGRTVLELWRQSQKGRSRR